MNKKRIPQAEDGTKIYSPHDVIPLNQSNIITDNYAQDSKLLRENNALLARKWVDENQK